MYRNNSTSVNKLTKILKKNKYNNEIIIEVKKLNCSELLTASKKDFLFFLPMAKPTIPSVEKAQASRKKDANITNCIKIALTAKKSSPSFAPK